MYWKTVPFCSVSQLRPSAGGPEDRPGLLLLLLLVLPLAVVVVADWDWAERSNLSGDGELKQL